MPENQVLSESTTMELPPAACSKWDRVTLWFLGAVTLLGIIYVGFGWTPSSYGLMLEKYLQVPDAGPTAGSGRDIRSDEWTVETPYFQAAVRNRFQRVNQTSFYREDLRNYYALPLADWSLIFKPQMWAFFLLSPAIAFSIYWAIWMCIFLAGYHLLFRQLGVPSWLAAAAAVMLYFSGFVQFWWTTYASLLAGLPWILLIVLAPMKWWTKALVCTWAFPAFVLSHVYPTLLLTMLWGALLLILAFRPSLLRSPGNLAAIAAGALVAAIAVYAYYVDVIPVMRNTIYPAHRISLPGTTPFATVLSQAFPYLCFSLIDYQHFTGENICEIGTVGSFLPLLTLCLTRYRSLKDHLTRNALFVLIGGFIAITLWEVAPVPAWIGRILLWNTSKSTRWLFTSGFLLTLACLLIWSRKLISTHPFRITLFVLIGPAASLVFKIAWLFRKGQPVDAALPECLYDAWLCGLALAAGIAAWYIPAAARAPLIVITIALMNVYAFGRFNPLQPAAPIFHVPDSPLSRQLRQEAAGAPEGVLVDPRLWGATANGLGFRSVAHVLLAPQLDIFRPYFPTMNAERFNQIFNRYAHIHLSQGGLPEASETDVIQVPIEVFVPVYNVRRLVLGPTQPVACSEAPAGGLGNISFHDDQITIEGWAPWSTETEAQGIRVLSTRPLRHGILTTTARPDIAELMQDYRFVKSGFKLQLSSADGKPLRPSELVLVAFGTSHGETRLPGGGCP